MTRRFVKPHWLLLVVLCVAVLGARAAAHTIFLANERQSTGLAPLATTPTATRTRKPTRTRTFTPTATPTMTSTVPPTATPTPRPWPQLALAPAAAGFSSPVHVTHAGDGSGRIFVVEQGGHIRLIKSGVVQATDFLDIHARVSCCGEQGLLSAAFPPDYGAMAQKHLYVDYTNTNGDTVVARYFLTGDPDVADSSSEQIVLTIAQPYANHNGGQLAFSPREGYLYLGMGDGGSGGDPQNRAQNPLSLLGKMLRIDVESGAPTYTVPASNPFVGNPSYRPEIWALGLRNPWRFSFDRQTKALYIGDVGQDSYEEIDYQRASSAGGQNYGWRIMEGFHCYNPPSCSSAGLKLPVVEYDHSQGNCAVTGGLVYRGTRFPRMAGVYFYGDYCSGRIWGLRRNGGWQSTVLYDASFGPTFSISSFGDDEAGNLYAADYGNGVVMVIEDASP